MWTFCEECAAGMEKVFPAIKTFTNLPVHILLKLYQFGVWVVILTQYYTVFGDTVSLFLFINACLDVLLILVQSQRPVLKPIRSRDLPSVLCVLLALVNLSFYKSKTFIKLFSFSSFS